MPNKSPNEQQSKTAIIRLLLRILEEFKMVWNLSPKLGGNARRQLKDKVNEINQLINSDTKSVKKDESEEKQKV